MSAENHYFVITDQEKRMTQYSSGYRRNQSKVCFGLQVARSALIVKMGTEIELKSVCASRKTLGCLRYTYFKHASGPRLYTQ